MRRAALLASVAAMVAALLTDGAAVGQELQARSTFVAFRADAVHVIATLTTRHSVSQQVTIGLSAKPVVAQYGYQYFDPPAGWLDGGAGDVRPGERWLIHAAPGSTFQADAERIVGGSAGCEDAVGALLRVTPEQSAAFGAITAKYFIAERQTSPSSSAPSGSTVRIVPSPTTAEFRRKLRSLLDAVITRELPHVRAEAEPEVERMASSPVDYHRAWAVQVRSVEEALQRNHGDVRYDIQSFVLSPDTIPVHFVRAEWMVQRRKGFAVSLWLRGSDQLEIIDTNLRPASWLRMFEFQGGVTREHQGLVLNIFDRDHDGWGEVLMAQGGYESMTLSLLKYSAAGFQPTGIEYAYGC